MTQTTHYTSHGSVCTTIAPSATEHNKSIKAEDDLTFNSPLLTHIRPALEKEITAGNTWGISVYSEAINTEVERLRKLEEVLKLESPESPESLESRDWKDRYGIFVEGEQSHN
jgi:hypothetical protein